MKPGQLVTIRDCQTTLVRLLSPRKWLVDPPVNGFRIWAEEEMRREGK